jgi:hypothetical protein
MATDTPITDQVKTERNGKDDAYDPQKAEELATWCFGLLEHDAAERKKKTRETKWEEDWNFIQGDQWEAPRPSYKRAIVMNAWRRSFHIVAAVLTGGRPTLKIVPQGIIDQQALKVWQDALWATLRKENIFEQKYVDALTWAWIGDGGWLKIGYGRWAEIPGELPDVQITAPHPAKIYPDADCTDMTLAQCHHIIFRDALDLSTITMRYPSQGWRVKPDGEASQRWLSTPPTFLEPGSDTVAPAGGWRVSKDYRRGRAEVLEVWIDDPSMETFQADVLVGMDQFTQGPIIEKQKQWRPIYPYGRVITCTKDVVLRDIPNPYGKAFGWQHRWPFVFFPGALHPNKLWRAGLLSNKSETQRAINKSLSLLLENYIKCTAMLVIGDENAMEDEDWDLLSLVPGTKIRKRQGTEVAVVFPQGLPPHAFTFPDFMKNKLEEEVGIHDPPIAPGQAVAAKTVAFMQQKGSFLLGILAKLGDEALERLGARVLGLMRDRYVPGRAIPYFEGEQTIGKMVEIPELPDTLQLRVEATSAYQEVMSSAMLLSQAAAASKRDPRAK